MGDPLLGPVLMVAVLLGCLGLAGWMADAGAASESRALSATGWIAAAAALMMVAAGRRHGDSSVDVLSWLLMAGVVLGLSRALRWSTSPRSSITAESVESTAAGLPGADLLRADGSRGSGDEAAAAQAK